jgi:membrane-bound serine protease (ClpP class)
MKQFMRIQHRWIVTLWLVLFSITSYATQVTSLAVRGGIGPAVSDYVVRGITEAQDTNLILIRLDTPGGLDKSMRQMVSAILTSRVPVVVYVAPSGARATSAGTYLLYASTVAVMAPGTHVGAASPVNLATIPEPKQTNSEEKTLGSINERKAMNDAVAYIRTLAQLRGRDITFAEEAVLNAKTLTAPEALKAGVINFMAQDMQDLFRQLNGMEVTQAGRTIKISTNDLHINQVKPDWRMRFLWVITDPSIAYLLLLLGIYGIFFELVNPGFIAPGVIGAVAICVALYALHMLPISYAGLALIFLGITFVIAETFVPSFGALGLGGTVAFILGSVLLIDPDYESYRISWSLISAMAAFNVMLFLVGLNLALRSRRRPVQNGANMLMGASGKTLGLVEPRGQAMINGEIWSVYSKHAIRADAQVKVVAIKGICLEVEEQLDEGEV